MNIVLPHSRGHVGMHWNFQPFSMFPYPSLRRGTLTDHAGKTGMGRSTLDVSKSVLSKRASIPWQCRSINVGSNGAQRSCKSF